MSDEHDFLIVRLQDTRPTMCFQCLLPIELVEWLITFVPPHDIIRFSQVCHYWRELTEDAPQWKTSSGKQENINQNTAP